MTTEARDAFGFPIGTRWIRVDAFGADGKRLGHAVADVLDAGSTAQASSNAVGALVEAYTDRIATTRVSWGT